MSDPLRAALGGSDECPDVEALAAAEENPAVLRHLRSCSRCQTELAMLREFENAEAQPEEAASVQWMEAELRRRTSEFLPAEAPPSLSAWDRVRALVSLPGRGTVALLAASLLAVLGAGLYFGLSPGLDRPLNKSGATWRSDQFEAISPAGDVAQAPSRLRWEPLPGAARYRVELREVDGTSVWSGETDQTAIDLPEIILTQLRPGRAFLWQATAYASSGAKMAATNLQSFHILATGH